MWRREMAEDKREKEMGSEGEKTGKSWRRAVKGKKRRGRGREGRKEVKGEGKKRRVPGGFAYFFFFFHPFNDHPPVVLSAGRGRGGARGKCGLRGCGTF